MSDNIKVVVKVRPLIAREIDEKLLYCWRVEDNALYQIDQNGKNIGQRFTFDKVYDKETKTLKVYEDIAKPIVKAATKGINGTIFAYGQTSSGKTYTMTGADDSPGIVQLAVQDLFDFIKNVPDRDFLLRVSYLEIYNETLKDLLNIDKMNIKIHETLQGLKVDATEKVVSTQEEVFQIMKEGDENRKTGATNMNEKSSRSHSIFQITIESREHSDGAEEEGCVHVSQLNLVDLAGSERAGQTGATGIRFKEGTHINKSLSTLALVIKQLSEDSSKFINYRDSKLTRILQNSLGGNANTSIICAVTPATLEETVSTLQFANRAKSIKNKPQVNEVHTSASMIQSLTKELTELKNRLEDKKNVEEDNQKLMMKIKGLQRQILNGFTRRSTDLASANRRKTWCAPRRVTINTLHTIEEDCNPPYVNKFCTPAFKYNPLTVAGSSDFTPIHPPSGPHLLNTPAVNESQRVTPPITKHVGFNDEVIEIDSDDDEICSNVGASTCSPYHKCFGTQTPPCILRAKAEKAERNLQDIVELTEREKIFAPTVVELMEKIEQNTTVVTELQEQLLKRDADIKTLTTDKEQLRLRCEDYEKKLVDWECSYDTLKKKSKGREEELLSLLDEKKGKPKTVDRLLNNFMDMSRDLSLVMSSDNESVNEPDATQGHEIKQKTNDRGQLFIDNLEQEKAKLQERLDYLEQDRQSIQSVCQNLKEKLSLLDSENCLLKSTVDSLNSTVKTQKHSLDSINNDIKFYSNRVHELQDQIKARNNEFEDNFNEIIANEEQLIVNNDNIKKLIDGFTNLIGIKNKEVCDLKTVIDSYDTKIAEDYKVKFHEKEKEVSNLEKTILTLQQLVKENEQKLTIVTQDNLDLIETKKTMMNDLENLDQHNKKLEIQHQSEISTKDEQINSLLRQQSSLESVITQKEIMEQKLSNLNQSLLSTVSQFNHCVEKNQLGSFIYSDNIVESIPGIDNISLHYEELSKILHKLASNVKLKTGELEKKLVDISESNTMLRDEMTEKHSQISELSKLKVDLDKVEKICLEKNNECEELKIKVDSLVREIEKLTDGDSLEMKNKKVENLEQEIVYLKSLSLTQLETIDKLSSENADLDCSNKAATNGLLTLEEKYKNLKNEFEASLIEYENKERELTVMNKNLLSQIKELNLQIENLHITNINANCEKCSDLHNKLTEKIENLEILQKDIVDKERHIETLIEKGIVLNLAVQKLENTLHYKENECADMRMKLENSKIETDTSKKSDLLEIMTDNDRDIDVMIGNCTELRKTYNNCEIMDRELNSNKKLFEDILKEIGRLLETFSIDKETVNIHLEYSEIPVILKEINASIESMQFSVLDSTELTNLKQQIFELRTVRTQLENNLFDLDRKLAATYDVIDTLKSENADVKHNLNESNNVLECLKTELCNKSDDIEMLTKNVIVLKEQLDLLDKENVYIKNYCEELKLKIQSVQCTNSILDTDIEHIPFPLSKLCLNKVVDMLYNENISTTPSSSNTNVECVNLCNCKDLLEYQQRVEKQNKTLKNKVDQLNLINKGMKLDLEEGHREIEMLSKLTNELFKKISNHRTSLSTFSATSFAENNLLKCRVKALQHHQSRFHKVCEQDIPEVKKQLLELLNLLQNDANCALAALNSSFKNSLHLTDRNPTLSALKNESNTALDGDLLMLDTNITLSTIVDTTLTTQDETCFSNSRVYTDDDVDNEVQDLTITENTDVHGKYFNGSQIENVLETTNKPPLHSDEEVVVEYDTTEKLSVGVSSVEALATCKKCEELLALKLEIEQKLEDITKDNLQLIEQNRCIKEENRKVIEEKYNNLQKESLQNLEYELEKYKIDSNNKMREIANLKSALEDKSKQLNQFQEENVTLSTDLMEYVSEVDKLKTELDTVNLKRELEKKTLCPNCVIKDDLLKRLEMQNRDNSDTQSSQNMSLTYDTYRTLQSELNASKEDCRKITEELAPIKTHLERSSEPIELDENVANNSFEIKLSNPCANSADLYAVDKNDCYSFYLEKTDDIEGDLGQSFRIVEIMKLLYDNLIYKHGNEVENLSNKLTSFGESTNHLQSQIEDITLKHSKVCEDLKYKENILNEFFKVMQSVKSNINSTLATISKSESVEKSVTEVFHIFKENVLLVFDKEFSLSLASLFDVIIKEVTEKHKIELDALNQLVTETTIQLSEKESQYNLLQAQKQKMYEISSAVTLDIIRREKEFNDIVNKGFQTLIDYAVIETNLGANLTANEKVDILVNKITELNKRDCVVQYHQQLESEKNDLMAKIKLLSGNLETKDQQLSVLKQQNDSIQTVNETLTKDKTKKEKELSDENNLQAQTIIELKSEVSKLKGTLLRLEDDFKMLNNHVVKYRKEISNIDDRDQLTNLIETIKCLEQENITFKSINEILTKEKEIVNCELEKAGNALKVQGNEVSKMQETINKLNEMLKEKIENIEELKSKLQKLFEEVELLKNENVSLEHKLSVVKNEAEAKNADCKQLNINLKTLEKSTEIQNNIIKRLQKQKDEQALDIVTKDKSIEEMSEKIVAMQRECEAMTQNMKDTRREIEELKLTKTALETRLSELEGDMEGVRQGRGTTETSARRKRQSFYDANRMIVDDKPQDPTDSGDIDSVFAARETPHDMFMDRDDHSEGSTPTNTRRRSLRPHEDQEQSETERGRSSMNVSRRRRQSIHDMHRGSLHTPPAQGDELNNVRRSTGSSDERDNLVLRSELESCKQELEDLRVRYKEVDEECETCAQYLEERDKQLHKLSTDKMALESELADMRKKLSGTGSNESCVSKTHVAVNTDEDWSNLHAVVVDRMSFDAEVEKNKKLTKALEEFHQKNRDLKAIIVKLQKKLEKESNASEISRVRSELQSCKKEIEELQERCRELDEECEMCAETLEERDQLYHKLSTDKLALEAELATLRRDCTCSESSKLIKTDAAVNTEQVGMNVHGGDMRESMSKKLQQCQQTNRELKAALSALQEAGNTANTDGESVKSEDLRRCEDELAEMHDKFRAVSAKYERRSQQMRELEDECRRLQKAKLYLEAKVTEHETASRASAKKKRQNLHDQHREQATMEHTSHADASIREGVKSLQDINEAKTKEILSLKQKLESIRREKVALEQRAPPTMFVSTDSAIVQEQHITDVMKENQKLRRVNAKLVTLCQKRGKSISQDNRENEQPTGD